ncbi:MAG: sigma-54-dependent Fis family transcriptional regulator [Nitrospirae bacterium]|nr:sigma-54-dependent Fis family transcriptional regulator [Nitrospirota bacterium]
MRVLVVDDDHAFRKHLSRALTRRGYEVWSAEGGKNAIHIVEDKSFDVAIVDLKMQEMDGIQVIEGLKNIQPSIVGIVLTGYGSIPTAVKALKLGAYHYLTKPCQMAELETILKEVQNERHRQPGRSSPDHYQGIVGKSQAIQNIIDMIQIVKDTSLPALICGESGTGKELVARAVHFDSCRKENPFIAINCASLKPELLENEFFGHVKGAFTGATNSKDGLLKTADGGTLFIDEIADMDLVVQASLLRFIETGLFRPLGSTKEVKVNVRIVAAINKDIEEEVKMRRFRHDLYYRLNVCRINIPSLRERIEDIPLLVDHLLTTSPLVKDRTVTISSSAMEIFLSYNWPGNVRELFNLLGRVILMTKESMITKGHLVTFLPSALRKGNERASSLKDIEKRYIVESLKAQGGNISATARALGIDRRTLQRKISGYRIQ